MSSGWIILLEFGGVVGVVLGLGGWELWRLRRERSRDAQRADPVEKEMAQAEDTPRR